ncbi:hypothetical protein [Pseudonocardia sp. HH130630-07]|uniref:hypothetical protein n=1 Tax=Pseudonocardia sp. HH130630-07 TaxID=1690815 RepID=UPI0008150E9D|nr:hypothetical protein [Pseudonocardia sp. HH130630-07]ANY08154.1 hypothetical protein AFB00_19795 [Pseudonocardia sp. HH130630-07]
MTVRHKNTIRIATVAVAFGLSAAVAGATGIASASTPAVAAAPAAIAVAKADPMCYAQTADGPDEECRNSKGDLMREYLGG